MIFFTTIFLFKKNNLIKILINFMYMTKSLNEKGKISNS